MKYARNFAKEICKHWLKHWVLNLKLNFVGKLEKILENNFKQYSKILWMWIVIFYNSQWTWNGALRFEHQDFVFQVRQSIISEKKLAFDKADRWVGWGDRIDHLGRATSRLVLDRKQRNGKKHSRMQGKRSEVRNFPSQERKQKPKSLLTSKIRKQKKR